MEKEQPIPEPIFTIEADKISCEFCSSFGSYIVTHQDQVIISSGKDIRIFKYDSQQPALIQTITFDRYDWIGYLTVNGETLAVSISGIVGADPENIDYGSLEETDFEEKVLLYKRIADTWEIQQDIPGNRINESFGQNIDINNDRMVISGHAYCMGYGGPCSTMEGRVYIYKKTGHNWILDQTLMSEDPEINDGFGRAVAIQGDFLIISSWFGPVNIYNCQDSWELVRSEPVGVGEISHEGNSFMVFGDDGNLYSFILDSANILSQDEIPYELFRTDMSGVFVLNNGHALVADMYTCYLLEYVNGQWIEKAEYSPNNHGLAIEWYSMAISDKYAIMSFMDSDVSYIDYVHFYPY
jgi:hypothetical protein